MAVGYPDCNDAQVLAHDPIHKMMAGRAPLSGDRLASQATLSRFENAIGPAELYRLVDTIADTVIGRHRRRLRNRAKQICVMPSLLWPNNYSWLNLTHASTIGWIDADSVCEVVVDVTGIPETKLHEEIRRYTPLPKFV